MIPTYIYLVGQENVEHAAQGMQAAAERFEQAVSYLNQVLEQHLRHFEELVAPPAPDPVRDALVEAHREHPSRPGWSDPD